MRLTGSLCGREKLKNISLIMLNPLSHKEFMCTFYTRPVQRFIQLPFGHCEGCGIGIVIVYNIFFLCGAAKFWWGPPAEGEPVDDIMKIGGFFKEQSHRAEENRRFCTLIMGGVDLPFLHRPHCHPSRYPH